MEAGTICKGPCAFMETTGKSASFKSIVIAHVKKMGWKTAWSPSLQYKAVNRAVISNYRKAWTSISITLINSYNVDIKTKHLRCLLLIWLVNNKAPKHSVCCGETYIKASQVLAFQHSFTFNHRHNKGDWQTYGNRLVPDREPCLINDSLGPL